ncbi:MAG: FAD-dependent oxidoreductase [Deltaproteobacteria bacterium]|nr:FAD-dependent oxidoreductase [Deltaproteobacteria bacterium]
MTRVVILGAGPAGVGAAYRIHRGRLGRATVLERSEALGGAAGSFENKGIWCDFGSHRLHPSVDPEILRELRELLGDDLRLRERRGRIRLRGRWLSFPLRPWELDRGFLLGVALDLARQALRGPTEGQAGGDSRRPGIARSADTFESVVRDGLGDTIADEFYLPYARKIWGLEAERLSGAQARRRISARTPEKLARRLLSPGGRDRYFYPRRGFGQLTSALAVAAQALGAQLRTSMEVTRARPPLTPHEPWRLEVTGPSGVEAHEADVVLSTIPASRLIGVLEPKPPAEVLAAAAELSFRAMVLVYLEVPVDRLSSVDAHYFPEANVRFARVSEPKNYFGATEPPGRTILCAELPCEVGDETWRATDSALGAWVVADLAQVGMPLPCPAASVVTKRLRAAYPICAVGYESALETVMRYLQSQPRLLSFGRQGLFAHDNTHHALLMAYRAVDCIEDGGLDRAAWERCLAGFQAHVVED